MLSIAWVYGINPKPSYLENEKREKMFSDQAWALSYSGNYF